MKPHQSRDTRYPIVCRRYFFGFLDKRGPLVYPIGLGETVVVLLIPIFRLLFEQPVVVGEVQHMSSQSRQVNIYLKVMYSAVYRAYGGERTNSLQNRVMI